MVSYCGLNRNEPIIIDSPTEPKLHNPFDSNILPIDTFSKSHPKNESTIDVVITKVIKKITGNNKTANVTKQAKTKGPFNKKSRVISHTSPNSAVLKPNQLNLTRLAIKFFRMQRDLLQHPNFTRANAFAIKKTNTSLLNYQYVVKEQPDWFWKNHTALNQKIEFLYGIVKALDHFDNQLPNVSKYHFNSKGLDWLKDDVSIIEKKLSEGVHFIDLNYERSLLIVASMLDRTAHAIPVLLKHGVNPNARDIEGNTAIHWAIANASTRCAWNLLKHGANYKMAFDLPCLKYRCQTPLQLAIAKGRRKDDWNELVSSLIAVTKDLDSQDVDGNTALHLACVRRDLPWIKALITNGASLSIKNKNGQTPKAIWSVSSERAWEILHGSSGTTTFDPVARDKMQDSFPELSTLSMPDALKLLPSVKKY